MSLGLKIFENITPKTTIYQVAYGLETEPVAIFQTRIEAEEFLANQ
jgi:hypothetical protein